MNINSNFYTFFVKGDDGYYLFLSDCHDTTEIKIEGLKKSSNLETVEVALKRFSLKQKVQYRGRTFNFHALVKVPEGYSAAIVLDGILKLNQAFVPFATFEEAVKIMENSTRGRGAPFYPKILLPTQCILYSPPINMRDI